MTPDKIQQTIATFDGWKPGPSNTWEHPETATFGAAAPPRYLEDLNACHGVEGKLNGRQFRLYAGRLDMLITLDHSVTADEMVRATISATPQRRSHALAETISAILKARAEIAAESAASQASATDAGPLEPALADPAPVETCQGCGDKMTGHEDENGTHCRWCVTMNTGVSENAPSAAPAPAVSAINV